MFDLIVYDARRTEKLLLVLKVDLPGKAVESAQLPTTEQLVLMREGRQYSLYLLGASPLMPSVALEIKQREHHAPLLIPLTARRLMAGAGKMHLHHASRSEFKELLRAKRIEKQEVKEDVEVSIEQH